MAEITLDDPEHTAARAWARGAGESWIPPSLQKEGWKILVTFTKQKLPMATQVRPGSR
jgi:hypothetical protein